MALLCFLVGAVVAFLGATVLKEFGASIYTVELVGYSFLREFGAVADGDHGRWSLGQRVHRADRLDEGA